MAGEWLKFDCSLPEKPEVLSITAAMGWDDPDLAVGKLMRVFRWFDQHTTNGNAAGVTAALLDRVIGVPGMSQAMAAVGWLVIKSDGISLHNFDRHNGATAKSRAQTAKRVANHRGNADCNAPTVTVPLAREEKRREEVSKATPSHPPAKADVAKPATAIPCPYQAIVDRYHEYLPSLPSVRLLTVSRQREMRKFWGWVLSSKRADGTRRATTADEALAWVAEFFSRAAMNDFLTGKTPRDEKHSGWECDLDFLLTERGMKHVIERTKDAA